MNVDSTEPPNSDSGTANHSTRTFSATLGSSAVQGTWDDQRTGTWPELVILLNTHIIGPKDGRCFTPATFRGTRRHQDDADQIDLVVLDSDAGHGLEEIVAAVQARGWAAILHSTHSHMTTHTKVNKAQWVKFLEDCPLAAERTFLTEKKGYLWEVTDGAHVIAEDDETVTIEHAPVPKFRTILPLSRPWRAADFPNQGAANATWKERIEAVALALGLAVDQSCTDTSRLFYLPRHPDDGRQPVATVIEGADCDIWSLASSKRDDEQSSWSFDENAWPGGGTMEFTDPSTGECIDLVDWAREHAGQFEIVKALQARKPDVFTGYLLHGTNYDIRCVNEEAHTEPGADRATCVINASQSKKSGFRYYCNHAHCTGRDRLFFIRRMLEQGWLKIADLTLPEFLVGEDKPDSDPPPQGDDGWPEPLDFLADAEMTGAPELRREHLPEAIQDFVFDTAERMGVDPTAVALGAVVALASVMDDDWRIQPKALDDTWTENPRLWGANVGDPVLKTPILKAVTAPIDKMEAEALRDDSEVTQRAPARKVLVRQDEMGEWVAGFDRYRSGGKGGADRGAYLRLWNGGRYTIDRVIRGTFAVPNWSACILGGIQPGPIRQIARDAADDGLLQRFLFCVPARQTRGEDQQPNLAAILRYHALFPALAALHPETNWAGNEAPHVVLHQDAHEHRLTVLNISEAMMGMPDSGDRPKSALGKLPGQWARLTLVFHLIGIADSRARGVQTDVVNVANAAAAMATGFLRDVLLPHLLRADAVMYSSVQAGHARWIAGYILSQGRSRICVRDLIQAYHPLRAPEHRRELTDVMNSLEMMDWVRAQPHPINRPPTAWRVNPKVLTRFAERGKRERAERDAKKQRMHEAFTKRAREKAR